ncbi:MAG: response regulator, partial [Myxococcota bacterium]
MNASMPTRVLVVEDQEHDRKFITRLLGRDSMTTYEITETETLDDARSVLESSSVDIVLAEYRLPDGMSTELLGSMQDAARPAFIILSGMTTLESAQRLLSMGVEDYINKSALSVERLSMAIHNAIARQHYLRALSHSPDHDPDVFKLGHEASLYALDRHRRDLDEQISRLSMQFSFTNYSTTHQMTREFMARSMTGALNEPLGALRANLAFVGEDLSALREAIGAKLEQGEIELFGDLHDSMRDLNRATDRLEDITQSLRSFRSQPDVICDEVVLEALFERCVAQLSERLSLRPGYTAQPSARTPVNANEGILTWVLITLIGPALLSGHEDELDRPTLQLDVHETEREVRFHIDDITTRAARMMSRGRSFEHLGSYNTDEELFALSMAADSIARMGGTMEVTQGPSDTGTRFIITLPKFVFSELEETTLTEGYDLLASRPSKALDLDDVLMIEDNPADIYLCEHLLRQYAPHVKLRHARTIAQGLELIAERPPRIVFLDLKLPDAQGINGLRALLSAHPNLLIIVLSGNAEDHIARNALAHGAQDYLVKGAFTGGDLKRSVQYALARSSRHPTESGPGEHQLAVSLDEVRHGLSSLLTRTSRRLGAHAPELQRLSAGLVHDIPGADALPEFMETLTSETAQLDALAGKFIDNMVLPPHTPVNVETLVTGAVEHYVEPRVRSRIALQGPRALVLGDRPSLERAVAATILNALESRVTRRVDVRVEWEFRGSDVVVAISDDGPGMPAEVRQ